MGVRRVPLIQPWSKRAFTQHPGASTRTKATNGQADPQRPPNSTARPNLPFRPNAAKSSQCPLFHFWAVNVSYFFEKRQKSTVLSLNIYFCNVHLYVCSLAVLTSKCTVNLSQFCSLPQNCSRYMIGVWVFDDKFSAVMLRSGSILLVFNRCLQIIFLSFKK